ncbi:twin-arginine translocase subunit TatC [Candidatus Nomurabacteria bacterium]|jgi:sec-independent protein translocase protein TatC|nr:MAG: twin-arginine translocase subunit TatC [Candidatus Nomurabacteria bacterium]
MDGLHQYLHQYSNYFNELQWRLLSLLRIFALVFIIGFFTTSPLIKLFIKHLAIKDVLIVTTAPFQLINLAMSAGFFLASVVVTPFFVYHLYAFLSPGLLKLEKKLFIALIPVSIPLFFLGFGYGFAILYFAIETIAHLNTTLGIVNYWDITRFVSEIVLTASLLGLVFEFPIVITFLIRTGFTTVRYLRSKRRHAIVFIFILVSLLPPTDGLSLVLMALPMVLIYELTILVNSSFKSRHSLIIK